MPRVTTTYEERQRERMIDTAIAQLEASMSTGPILELARHDDKRKTPELKRYRYMTRAEAFQASSHILFVGRDNRVGTLKVNGSMRTWKTQPDRIELPLKYGMREYTVFTFYPGYTPRRYDLATDSVVTDEPVPDRIGNGVAWAIVPVD